MQPAQWISLAQTRIFEEPALYSLLTATLLLFISVIMLTLRLGKLTKGASGDSLEKIIADHSARATALEEHASITEKALENLDTRLQGSVRGVSLERFDPFQNASGQQSFAAAFLNEHGSGVVVSSIHARDGVRVYAKDVEKFTSERELSEEEKKVIIKARKTLT